MERRLRIIYLIVDLLSVALAWLAFNYIRFCDLILPTESFENFYQFLHIKTVWMGQMLFPLLMICIYAISGYYNHTILKSRAEEFINTLVTALVGTVLIYLIAVFNDPIRDRANNFELLLMLWGLLFIAVYVPRLIITQSVRQMVKRGKITFNTLIIGNGHFASTLRKKIESHERVHGLKIVGYVDATTEHPQAQDDLPVYPLSNLEEICVKHNISKLVVTSHRHGMKSTMELVGQLIKIGKPVLMSPTLYELISAHPRISSLRGEPLVDITRSSMSDFTQNVKRIADIILSIIALIVLAPILGIIAICIKLDSEGPVLYSQERVGLNNRRFNILKFRTMLLDAEKEGPQLSHSLDKRITRIGHFLRKYRLDEFPQFWNVVRGDMSLVGPRPERQFYIEQIVQKAPYYILVHQLRPGITSLGMVKYGYASSVDQMIERLQYDLIYLDNVSIVADLKIILYTINTVLGGRGV